MQADVVDVLRRIRENNDATPERRVEPEEAVVASRLSIVPHQSLAELRACYPAEADPHLRHPCLSQRRMPGSERACRGAETGIEIRGQKPYHVPGCGPKCACSRE